MKPSRRIILVIGILLSIFIFILNCSNSDETKNVVPTETTTTTTTTTTTIGILTDLNIGFITPSGGSYGPCDPVEINGTYTITTGKSLEILQYKIGTGIWIDITDNANNQWSKIIPQNELIDNQDNIIYVRIKDSSMLLMTKEITIHVEAYASPQINITSGTKWEWGQYNLTGTFSTSTSPNSTLQYCIDNGSWVNITSISGNVFTAINVTGWINTHSIAVKVTDRCGQTLNANKVITNEVASLITWKNIPGGNFIMGDRWGDSGATNDKPAHTVQISAFKMSETEITIAQYCAFLNAVEIADIGRYSINMADSFCGITRIGSSGSYSYSVNSGRDNYPITYVTWTNSSDYCNYISGTLPSEAQWEYAAGGSSHYKFSVSNTFSCSDYCDSVTSCSHDKSSSCAVKSYSANGYGLYDMSGNLWEWCYDWYSITGSGSTGTSSSANSFYQNCANIGTVTDPINIFNSSDFRNLRGGSWYNSNSENFLSGYRNAGGNPNAQVSYIGFRCVR